MSGNNNEISGNLGKLTLPMAMTLAAFAAVSWYNSLDLILRVFITFRRFNGLYFWSLIIASLGVFFYPLVFLMKDFNVWRHPYINSVIIVLSWYAMVTGQAIVLYSRLYLIVRNERKIKWVLAMIIFNFCVFHISTTVLLFGVSEQNPLQTFQLV
jgi:hypothetical protein